MEESVEKLKWKLVNRRDPKLPGGTGIETVSPGAQRSAVGMSET